MIPYLSSLSEHLTKQIKGIQMNQSDLIGENFPKVHDCQNYGKSNA